MQNDRSKPVEHEMLFLGDPSDLSEMFLTSHTKMEKPRMMGQSETRRISNMLGRLFQVPSEMQPERPTLTEQQKRAIARKNIQHLCKRGLMEFVRVKRGDREDTICFLFTDDKQAVAIGASCQSDDDQLNRGEGRYHAYLRACRDMRRHNQNLKNPNDSSLRKMRVYTLEGAPGAATKILDRIRERHPDKRVVNAGYSTDSIVLMNKIMDRRAAALTAGESLDNSAQVPQETGTGEVSRAAAD